MYGDSVCLYMKLGGVCHETQVWREKMGSEMKIQVIYKDTIRPSLPTPHHLRNLSLSVFDQLFPDIYVPLLLFYPNDNNKYFEGKHSLVAERSKLLKKSLSEALTRFYPYAGNFQHNASICCNDHGAAYVEARVNCPMSKILNKPELVILKQLLPTVLDSSQADTCYLLLVKANFFECGGLAIGVGSSHKVADAYTLSKFTSCWAAIARGSNTITDHIELPDKFGVAASLFPQVHFLSSLQPALEFPQEKCITKRFVFDASKIAALKSKAGSATVENPTCVEVVSALIWKCAMEASRSNLGVVRPSELSQFVNIRKILVSPLAENLLGNLVGLCVAKTEASEVDDVQSLVTKFRKEMEEFKVRYGNGISGEEACEFYKEYGHLMKRDVDNYNCSSWCRFPFYEVDFGWGKPLWVPHIGGLKNLILLMDTRDGEGIEASLTLKEEDMAKFESNKELLSYASVNPPVI
ncbi:unnamed protein product [Malus baccata var. baccata]